MLYPGIEAGCTNMTAGISIRMCVTRYITLLEDVRSILQKLAAKSGDTFCIIVNVRWLTI